MCVARRQQELFLINRIAHDRSKARGADGYITIVTAVGADHAIIVTVLPVHAIEAWRVHEFGYGDPALGMPLSAFCPRYLAAAEVPIRDALRRVAGNLATLNGDLDRVAEVARSRIPAIRGLAEEMRGVSSQGIIHYLSELAN